MVWKAFSTAASKRAVVRAETGNTVLHELPMGYTALYAALRDAGADANARNFAGRTPLHCAAAAGDFQLARLLLRDGASATAAAHGGETPMHAAATADAQSAPAVVQCLAQHGGEPDVPNDAGVTALDVARSVAHGQATVVRTPPSPMLPRCMYREECKLSLQLLHASKHTVLSLYGFFALYSPLQSIERTGRANSP